GMPSSYSLDGQAADPLGTASFVEDSPGRASSSLDLFRSSTNLHSPSCLAYLHAAVLARRTSCRGGRRAEHKRGGTGGVPTRRLHRKFRGRRAQPCQVCESQDSCTWPWAWACWVHLPSL